MTEEQKKYVKECEENILELKSKIAFVRKSCNHANTKERPYYDYDRNCFEIKCIDCGEILFDGNYSQLESYRKSVNTLNVSSNKEKCDTLIHNGYMGSDEHGEIFYVYDR